MHFSLIKLFFIPNLTVCTVYTCIVVSFADNFLSNQMCRFFMSLSRAKAYVLFHKQHLSRFFVTKIYFMSWLLELYVFFLFMIWIVLTQLLVTTMFIYRV